MSHNIPIRHTDREKVQVGDYYDNLKRYYDNVSEHTIVKLHIGDLYVTTEPREMLITILGSCIAVCARDPIAKVAGMNHILLPGNQDTKDPSAQDNRYGAFAMEAIINDIIKRGGNKKRLEVKIFGGSDLMDSTAQIGKKNIVFVKKYLSTEGILVRSEDLGGPYPRRIHYFPDTGKVQRRLLKRNDDMRIASEESTFVKRQSVVDNKTDNIELFD